MPLDNRISNIIATPLPEHIKKQLTQRAVKNTQPNRDDANLLYLANKSGWVRLVSSIDINKGNSEYTGDMKYFSDLTGQSISNESDLAKLFVLFGGTSKYEKASNSGFKYLLRSGLGFDGAYGILGNKEIQDYGYRPIPGITDANIETQGRMGSIRKAHVNFKVWNRSQLDIIDALYFKLGYTMFLEWGHVVFYKSGSDILQKGEDYQIDPFEPGLTKESLMLKINKNVRESEGNYDAMIGLVTNFNFSFNQDGGYDCSLDIIGLGILADSLKINHPEGLPKLLEKEIQELNDVQRKIQEAKDKVAKDAEEKQKQEALNQQLQGKKTFDDILTSNAIAKGFLNSDSVTNKVSKIAGINSFVKNQGRPNYNIAVSDYNNYDTFVDLNNNGVNAFLLPHFGIALPISIDQKEFSNIIIDHSKTNEVLSKDYENYVSGFKSSYYSIPGVSNNPVDANTYFTNEEINGGKLNVTSQKNESKTNGFTFEYTTNYVSKINGNAYELVVRLDTPLNLNIERIPANTYFIQFLTKLNSEDRSVFIEDVVRLDTGFPKISFKGSYRTNVNIVSSGPQVGEVAQALGNVQANSTQSVSVNTFAFNFVITTTDTSIIKDVTVNKDYQTADYLKYKANLQNQAEQAANAKASAQALSESQLNAKNQQIEEGLQYQSSLEIALRSIQLYSLAYALQKSNGGEINSVNKVPLYGEDTNTKFNDSFAGQLFSFGVFSKFIKDLVNDNVKGEFDPENEWTINGKPISSRLDRLKYAAKYGFSSNLMNGSLRKDDLSGIQIDFKELLTSYVVPYEINQNTTEGSQINYPTYVRFDTLLMFLNHMCTLYDTVEQQPIAAAVGAVAGPFVGLSSAKLISSAKTKESQDGPIQAPILYIDFNTHTTQCLSSPRHLSTDPTKFLIPFQGHSSDYSSLFDKKLLDKSLTSISPVSGSNEPTKLFNPEKEDAISAALPSFKYIEGDKADAYRGRPLNVVINIDYLINLVHQYSKHDGTNEVFLKSFLEQILNDMNKSLGNFNALALAYNDSSNTYYIVDAQLNAPKAGDRIIKSDSTDEIPLYGVASIAKSFEMHTEISSRLSNMIAISSNSHPDQQVQNSTDATSFGYINQSFRDRYVTYKQSANSGNTNNDTEKNAAARFDQCIREFYSTTQPSDKNISMATNYYIKRMSELKGTESPTRASSMIPVSVNFTIDGIGGIPMFSGFTIDKNLLPYTYNSRNVVNSKDHKVGFTVVGKTDNISDNAWNTAIKGSMVYLKDTSEFNGPSLNKYLAQGLALTNANPVVTNPTTPGPNGYYYSNILFANDSSPYNVNPNLLNDVNTAAVRSNVKVTVAHGHDISGHAPDSRHYSGNAVDIGLINGIAITASPNVKQIVEKFTKELDKLGYTMNVERGQDKAYLTYGFPGHSNHVHVSNKV